MEIYKIVKTNLGIAIIFAIIYMFYVKSKLSKYPNKEFKNLNSSSSFVDFLYFSIGVQSTVGFSNIYPRTHIARILVIIQQITLLFGLELIKKIY
jgi:hypothetical protein